MAYKVSVSTRARLDLIETADYIREHASPEAANRWQERVVLAIESLGHMPNRFAVADESRDLDFEVRQLLVFRHRILYRVFEDSKIVQILRIYHSAREDLGLRIGSKS